ncbi:hypothetical protein EK21DRAFT_112062 [Setomelanomma holmii]|uniref:F-box domain-containing protein n=1 Tax=Setomelanomma holmii TaxID=210430 RepID=A0A9P4H8Q1_9PLEO|nr:hypothetical protein EK21DRAFT_112062 [Setomelanomma holmii]
MVAPLDTLPTELINEVITYLRPHHLTKLARVSKRYRDFAQAALWRNIELHRQDAHDDYYAMNAFLDCPRAWFDDELRDPWSYRDKYARDRVFERHNAKFGTAVRNLYRTADQSQHWMVIATYVRHLCLTITHKSPPCIWDMMLSLPNLSTLEAIGQIDASGQSPPPCTFVREAKADKVHVIRLRGYIPAAFVLAMCEISVNSIRTLDLGLLDPPVNNQVERSPGAMWTAHYFAPRGPLWFPDVEVPCFTFLTHLHLCKPGHMTGGPDSWMEAYPEDEEHNKSELKNWTALIHAARRSLIELRLEQRPARHADWIMGEEMSPHSQTNFNHSFIPKDGDFIHHLLEIVFAADVVFPALKRLMIRGVNLLNIEDELGDTLEGFLSKRLPGVDVDDRDGYHMFVSGMTGAVVGWQNLDGLLPHLDPKENPFARYLDWANDTCYTV